jgi:hypothetical protein
MSAKQVRGPDFKPQYCLNREEGREGGREGGREEGRRRKERRKEGTRKGRKKGGREGRREGKKEGRKDFLVKEIRMDSCLQRKWKMCRLPILSPRGWDLREDLQKYKGIITIIIIWR